MSDEPVGDVHIEPGVVIAIDAEEISQIIIHTCHCPTGLGIQAANLIVDYLHGIMAEAGDVIERH